MAYDTKYLSKNDLIYGNIMCQPPLQAIYPSWMGIVYGKENYQLIF